MIRKVLAALLVSAATADRGAVELDFQKAALEIDLADIAVHAFNATSPTLGDLAAWKDFKAWAAPDQKMTKAGSWMAKTTYSAAEGNCRACWMVFGALFKGVDRAGFVEGAEWDPATFTLKVKLNQPQVYGELPSKSKIPILIQLDNQVTLTFNRRTGDQATVQVTASSYGMYTYAPKEGLRIYDAAMKAADGLLQKSCDPEEMQLDDCVQKEVAAVKSYLTSEWNDNINRFPNSEGKISEILKVSWGKKIVGMYAYRGSIIEAFLNWGVVMYSLVSACPLKFVSFEFEQMSKNINTQSEFLLPEESGNVHIYANTLPSQESADAYTKCNARGLYAKAERIGMNNLLSQGKRGVKQGMANAPSGMNFALLMALGNPEIQSANNLLPDNDKITGAEAVSLANLFAMCEKCAAPGNCFDPQCEGKDVGRLGWANEPGTLFQ